MLATMAKAISQEGQNGTRSFVALVMALTISAIAIPVTVTVYLVDKAESRWNGLLEMREKGIDATLREIREDVRELRRIHERAGDVPK